MGTSSLAINLLKRVNAVNGVGLVRQARPLNLEGLRLAPKMLGDVCTFKPDRTLCPKFLKSLLEIDDKDTLKFVEQVKDKFLQQMGYCNSKLLKVKQAEHPAYVMSFNFDSGVLAVHSLPNMTKQQKIAAIRHELDHFDKAACLFKSVGAEEYCAALQKRFGQSAVEVNKNFWETMSKDAGVENFDFTEYLDAWKNSRMIPVKRPDDFNCIRNSHYYATDAFEVSGYSKQKKVLQALSQNDKVLADAFGKPLKNIIAKLDSLGLSDEQKLKVYIELCDAARFKISKDSLLLMQNYQNIKNGAYGENVKKAIDRLPAFVGDSETYDLMKNVENWLSKECYSINDILARGLA